MIYCTKYLSFASQLVYPTDICQEYDESSSLKKSKVISNGLRGGEKGLSLVTATEDVKSFMQVMSHGSKNLQHQHTIGNDEEESLGVNSILVNAKEVKQSQGEPVENNLDKIPFFTSQSKVTADSPEDVSVKNLLH